METYVLFAWLDFIPNELKLLTLNLGLGMVQKHAISRLPNDFIPYVNTAVSTGVYMAMGNDFGTALQLGGGTAMVAKLLQTVTKRTIQTKKARSRGMGLKQFIEYERTI